MNRHLTDEEILDLLVPDVEPEAPARDHLAACPECRRRVEAERPLAARLARLPRETDPPRDMWPELRAAIGFETRLAAAKEMRPAAPAGRDWMRLALRAAAAIAIFVLGAATGRALGPPETGREPTIPREPLAVAAEVQRTGTAYVAALARFRSIAEVTPDPVVEQARDVALAAVHGAAWELTRMQRDDPTAREIVSLVGAGRRAGSPDGDAQ